MVGAAGSTKSRGLGGRNGAALPTPPPPSFPFERLVRAAERRIARFVRRARDRRGAPVKVEALSLRSTVGYKIDAWIHQVEDPLGPRKPGLVLCPGIDDDSRVFLGSRGAPIGADEAARLGFVVLRFDPAGRGESWGEEDHGGPEHQDEVARAVHYLAARPEVDPGRVGVLAISLGVAMGVGGVALRGAPAAWVVDWEGPCDREIITAGGTRMDPAGGHAMTDEVYWRPREAVRHVGAMRAGYLRIQAEVDHAQPGELRHAMRMIEAAADGDLPWFQLNDHPRGELPALPRWVGRGSLAANRALRQALRGLRDERRVG